MGSREIFGDAGRPCGHRGGRIGRARVPATGKRAVDSPKFDHPNPRILVPPVAALGVEGIPEVRVAFFRAVVPASTSRLLGTYTSFTIKSRRHAALAAAGPADDARANRVSRSGS